jgi:energy-coupling factor transport system permease protein
MIAASTVCMLTGNLLLVMTVLAVLIITFLIGGVDFINIFRKARAMFALIVFLFVIQASFMGIPQGLQLAGLLSLRLLVIVMAALVLLEGDIRDYLLAMVQMKIPYSFAFMVMVGLHFLPILRGEAVNVYHCMQLRGKDFKKIGIVRKIKAYAAICLPVMAGALRRAEETSIAMETRAFRSMKGRTYMRRLKMKARDIILCILWPTIFILLFIIFNYMGA